MLRELSECYARRAREFSDAVASLGHHPQIGPEFLELIQEITLRRRLCDEVAGELDQYMQRTADLDPSQAFWGLAWGSFRAPASGRGKETGSAGVGSFSEQHGAGRSDCISR